jgi:hypothetical protein
MRRVAPIRSRATSTASRAKKGWDSVGGGKPGNLLVKKVTFFKQPEELTLT